MTFFCWISIIMLIGHFMNIGALGNMSLFACFIPYLIHVVWNILVFVIGGSSNE